MDKFIKMKNGSKITFKDICSTGEDPGDGPFVGSKHSFLETVFTATDHPSYTE